MAEPTIVMQFNDGSEATPNWTTIDTAVRWTGPGGVGDAFAAPIGENDDAFFDDTASPNDGEFWHDTTTDAKSATAGRAIERNTLRVLETGATDPTADPPEFTAYDDATDAGTRTNPTVWVLAGTSGTSNVSCMRAVETTSGDPAAGWGTQDHDTTPTVGDPLDGNQTNEKVVCATILAASGNKTFQVAACAPHDATPGLTTFVYCLQYTYE
jgi:hypothetical protein